MVRYYGYYSNFIRGKRKKQNADEWILFILEIWMLGWQSVQIEGPYKEARIGDLQIFSCKMPEEGKKG